MDLDDELRQLFASDRMDVPVRPDAEHLIVAGARRVRRRRIAAAATGGAVVMIVLAGVVLAGGQPDAMPPTTRIPTTSPVTTSLELTETDGEPAQQPPNTSTEDEPGDTGATDSSEKTETSTPGLSFPVLGPTGFRGLELGQTVEEAQATGVFGERDPAIGVGGGCVYYKLLMDGPGDYAGFVLVRDTVLVIDSPRLETPEGIGPGSTVEQAKAVYPDLDEQLATEQGSVFVAVPGNGNALYRLQFTDGEVERIALQAANQPCFM